MREVLPALDVQADANGTGFTTDRFRRVHELALHFYRGPCYAEAAAQLATTDLFTEVARG